MGTPSDGAISERGVAEKMENLLHKMGLIMSVNIMGARIFSVRKRS